MKIVFYCQYVMGMGHLFRSLQIADALSAHQVTLVAGGQNVDAPVPPHVRLVRLPALYMDEYFTRLIPEDTHLAVETVMARRKAALFDLLGEIRPDLFMVELYPFGRTLFQFELDPLLSAIGGGAFGRVHRVCSLRDVLVEKRDPVAYEARVIAKLNDTFDLLLVHSDGRFLRLEETFSRVRDIRIPVHYTGFVARKPPAGSGRQIRRALKIGRDDTFIVASAGGGRTGHRLLQSAVTACRPLCEAGAVHLHVFTGPFMDEAAYTQLSELSGNGVRVRRFTRRLPAYLDAADLSISMAGYNTCMDLLVAQVPALVYPYTRQQEQPIRAEKIRPLLPMRVLTDGDLAPETFRRHILDMVARKRPEAPLPLDLDGARNTARRLRQWVVESAQAGA